MSNGSSTPWFGVSMALIGVIVGYGIALGMNGGIPAKAPAEVADVPANVPEEPEPEADDVKPVDPERDHIYGDKDAEISLIEYSDFECPFCQRHHPVAKQLIDSNDDVNWVYRHFPLSFHPNAQKAAEASECAWDQGGNDAFWEMADIIFEKGPDNSMLSGYAKEIGLDVNDFDECLESGKFAEYVKDDMESGSRAGVSGTPGNILLNNSTGDVKSVSGAQPLGNFQAAVEDVR